MRHIIVVYVGQRKGREDVRLYVLKSGIKGLSKGLYACTVD